jgi:hypothetical protein
LAPIVFVERGHRRIVVQYAKRVVGSVSTAGSSTHIPLKVNTGRRDSGDLRLVDPVVLLDGGAAVRGWHLAAAE